MKPENLADLLRAPDAPLVVNVLPADAFAARHLAGSRNACVYETAFVDHMAKLAPDKRTPVVVYGAGGGSLDCAMAVEKLRAAGYERAHALEGDPDAWVEAGLTLEGDGNLPSPPVADGIFQVNTVDSLIRWTGRNPFNHHHGTLPMSDGEIVLKQGALVSAWFTVDMSRIACDDLTDSSWNNMLIRHLRDADFFDVKNHPAAEFRATGSEPIPDATIGTPNHLIRGDFTLRGVTRPVGFDALVATADGRRITGQALLDLDRTEFGSLYGSGKFFRFLGPHVVNDIIHLHLKIHADKTSA